MHLLDSFGVWVRVTRMMFQMLLAEFCGKLTIVVWEILLIVVAVIAMLGQPILISMMRIGQSPVTAIGDEPSDLTSIATSYS